MLAKGEQRHNYYDKFHIINYNVQCCLDYGWWVCLAISMSLCGHINVQCIGWMKENHYLVPGGWLTCTYTLSWNDLTISWLLYTHTCTLLKSVTYNTLIFSQWIGLYTICLLVFSGLPHGFELVWFCIHQILRWLGDKSILSTHRGSSYLAKLK